MSHKDHVNSVKEAWEKYVLTGTPLPEHLEGVRPIILESWRRSQKNSLTAQNARPRFVSESELHSILNHNRLLIDIALPYLQQIAKFVSGSNSQIILTNADGCILKCLFTGHSETTGPYIETLSDDASIIIGSINTESTVGTSGVSLCLHEQKLISVYGEEHFNQKFHRFSCCGAPLFGPTGNLLGCISLACPRELYHQHTLGMLASSADGIAKEFRLANTNYMLESMLNSYSGGVALIDDQGRILRTNSKALQILRMTQEELTGKRLSQVILHSTLPGGLESLRNILKNVECSLTTFKKDTVDILLTTAHENVRFREFNTTILFFNTQKSIHHLANQVMGFSASYTADSIIGVSEEIKQIRSFCLIAAETPSNVLIEGESGTGKELVAQSIHNASDRASGPFIDLNCGSIPTGLIESELFGYEGGTFTGSKRNGNPGKFELASGGTLFLDEIGDMPLELQNSLLRVLQTRTVTRLGGKSAKHVDVKIIAATNVDLQKAVEENTFRSDLFYRLNVLSIEIPPLRERKEDIIPLLDHFLEQYNHMLGKNIQGFSQEAQSSLMEYDWPGNVRELENVVERAVNFCDGALIQGSHLPQGLIPRVRDSHTDRLSPEIREYETIIRLLKEEHGHAKSVAAKMGIPLSTFYRKTAKYNIHIKDYKKW